VSGWGNFFEDIKKDDKTIYEERTAKAAEFAATGKQIPMTEVYSKGNGLA
jgi:hypothetical protein